MFIYFFVSVVNWAQSSSERSASLKYSLSNWTCVSASCRSFLNNETVSVEICWVSTTTCSSLDTISAGDLAISSSLHNCFHSTEGIDSLVLILNRALSGIDASESRVKGTLPFQSTVMNGFVPSTA